MCFCEYCTNSQCTSGSDLLSFKCTAIDSVKKELSSRTSAAQQTPVERGEVLGEEGEALLEENW